MGVKCDLDKFYTNPEIAKELVKEIDLSEYDLIVEPSAGNGAFFYSVDSKENNIVGVDISPEAEGIIEKDWFEYVVSSEYKNVLILGNPPFGKRNKLSKDFIKHALSFENVKTIAFVLPNVFKKHTNQKVFPKCWRLAKEIDMPRDSFLLEGEAYHVPCSFFIWTSFEGEVDLRFDIDKYQSHPDFDFVKEDDFDFFLMGASPKVMKSAEEISPNNRGYYIKANIPVEELKQNILSIDWSKHGNSSANGGVSWYSKPEFVKVYGENKPKN